MRNYVISVTVLHFIKKVRKTQFKCLQTQPNKNDRLDVKLLHSLPAPPFSNLPFCCSKRSHAIASLLLLAFGNGQLILVAQGLVYFACTQWAMLCKNLPCLSNLALYASLEFTSPPWLLITFEINLCVLISVFYQPLKQHSGLQTQSSQDVPAIM